MIPTTVRIVSADFATTIRGIVPSYPLHQDQTWTPASKAGEVPGSRIRLYHGEWGFGEPEPDGIHGSGIEYGFDLRVLTSYRGLPEDEVVEMATSDGNQLWLALDARVDPTVAGLVAVQYQRYEPESQDPGNEYGSHFFRVRLLLTHD